MKGEKLFISGAEAAALAVNEEEVNILKCGSSESALKIFSFTEKKPEITQTVNTSSFLISVVGLRVFLCFEEKDFIPHFFTVIPSMIRKNSGGVVILLLSSEGNYLPSVSKLSFDSGIPFIEAFSPSDLYHKTKEGFKNSESFHLPIIIRAKKYILDYYQCCIRGEKEKISLTPYLFKESLSEETYENLNSKFLEVKERFKLYSNSVQNTNETKSNECKLPLFKSKFFCAGCPLILLLHIFKKGLYLSGLSLDDVVLLTNLECIKDVDSDWNKRFESLSLSGPIYWALALAEAGYSKPSVLFVNSLALTEDFKAKIARFESPNLIFIFDDNCRRKRNNLLTITPLPAEKLDVYNIKKGSKIIRSAFTKNAVSYFRIDGNLQIEKKKFVVIKESCIGIDKCKENCLEEILCPALSVTLAKKAEILQEECIKCQLCIEICPANAIKKVRKLK